MIFLRQNAICGLQSRKPLTIRRPPQSDCALRLSVRTPDFHSGKRGSTPLGRTTWLLYISLICDFSDVFSTRARGFRLSLNERPRQRSHPAASSAEISNFTSRAQRRGYATGRGECLARCRPRDFRRYECSFPEQQEGSLPEASGRRGTRWHPVVHHPAPQE